MIEYPTNGVVRRLQSRNSWNKIWMKRMTTNIFEAQQIKNTVDVSVELCNISKSTKDKYKKYFETHQNLHIQT